MLNKLHQPESAPTEGVQIVHTTDANDLWSPMDPPPSPHQAALRYVPRIQYVITLDHEKQRYPW